MLNFKKVKLGYLMNAAVSSQYVHVNSMKRQQLRCCTWYTLRLWGVCTCSETHPAT